MRFEGTSVSGALDAESITGGLLLRTKSGTISFSAVRGACDLQTETGQVIGEAIESKKINIKTTAGGVLLESQWEPPHGVLNVRTETGNIQISFWKKSKMKIHAISKGQVNVQFKSNPAAKFSLSAISETGPIAIFPALTGDEFRTIEYQMQGAGRK